MNDRVWEIAEKAQEYADDNFLGEPTWFEAYESKFAELIVLECAEICSRESDGHGMAFGKHCAIVIREHFGVGYEQTNP